MQCQLIPLLLYELTDVLTASTALTEMSLLSQALYLYAMDVLSMTSYQHN